MRAKLAEEKEKMLKWKDLWQHDTLTRWHAKPEYPFRETFDNLWAI